MIDDDLIGRRALLRAAVIGGAGLAAAPLFPAQAAEPATLSGEDIHLAIGHSEVVVRGRRGHAVTVNGTLPAPLIRLREGQDVRIHVTNHLDEDTSIHWHGLLLPFEMDGVPGVSFPGIRPGETFRYAFKVRQSGTYWFHSHSGLQEQQGLYGPIVIDPVHAHHSNRREHVIVLSDWTFLHPHQLIAQLKKGPGSFNRQRQTLTSGTMSARDRLMWGRMRMDPTDIADVTGSIYTYLVNGRDPAANWTCLFTPGEPVLLRIVNAAAMTIFNLRIPGLKLTVVAADGQEVVPVTVDELQIGNAETYDILVEPEDRAYTIVAETIDRSGMARASLAPQEGMSAPVPPLRPRPTLTMRDMGMGGMGDHAGHGGGGHDMRDESKAPPNLQLGPGVDMVAAAPVDRTGEPGIGLDDVAHRTLTYRDLVAPRDHQDRREPGRTIIVNLTGSMERFMWSIDGTKFSDAPEPIRLARDERVRLTMINHTMMTHPMHLHGHFFEIVNGQGARQPLKHTVNVLPGATLSIDLIADAPGDWAFHCHMLLHMHAGMMRVVTVRPLS